MTTPAHAVSLHLVEALEKSRHNLSLEDALESVNTCIDKLSLQNDVKAVSDGDTGVSIEGVSPRGVAILEEVKMRLNLPPCPEGECELDSAGVCKWCSRSAP